MNRQPYNIILYITIAVVTIFFIAFRFFNIFVQRHMEMQMYKHADKAVLEELKATRAAELKEERTIAGENRLTPNTIKVQKDSVLSENQYYWDANTGAILKGTDVLNRLQDEKAFAGAEETPEQFKGRMRALEERIKEYEQKVLADPNDDAARRKLKNLYMLKATLGGLKDVVTGK